MLNDVINKSKEQGVKSKNNKDLKIMFEEYEHAFSVLKSFSNNLQQVFIEILNTECIDKTISIDYQQLVGKINTIKGDIEEDSTKRLMTDIKDLCKSVESEKEKLTKIWHEYIIANVSKNDNMIQAIDNIIEHDAKFDELSNMRAQIVSQRIGDSSTIKDIEKYKKKSQELLKSLKLDKDSNIQKFIMKLSSEDEVHLDEITDEIFQWLKIHKMTNKIIVSL